MSLDNRYDVIIVGAGIGGLTAGAYLTKAGLKTLIIERSPKPGGYCGSFEKDGFMFDDAVHYFNNLGPSGFLRRICDELEITNKLEVVRIDPSDHLCMQDIRISIYDDIEKTIHELSIYFPSESDGIKAFFKLVRNFSFAEHYAKYSKKTFQQLLDEYFVSQKLKTAIGIFGVTLGLVPNELSALAALAYYRGSILDGGYHVVGGAQAFSDVLTEKIIQNGGHVKLSSTVNRIIIDESKIEGVELVGGEVFKSESVIANSDATQTFLKLIDSRYVDESFRKTIETMKPSLSNLIVYLGIKGKITNRIPRCSNYWYLPVDDYQKMSIDITRDDREDGFVHISVPSIFSKNHASGDKQTLMLFVGASFKNIQFWEDEKERLAEVLIERAAHAIPDLRSNILMKFSASPLTLARYTMNRDGSYRGWAPTLSQSKLNLIPQKTSISGLFLAGHWITTPVGHGGVSMVAQSGKNAAKAVTQFIKSGLLFSL